MHHQRDTAHVWLTAGLSLTLMFCDGNAAPFGHGAAPSTPELPTSEKTRLRRASPSTPSTPDWSTIPALATSPTQPATSLKAATNEQSLFFLVEGSGLGPSYALMLDTDGDATNGYGGADFMVQNGRLYRSDGPAWVNWFDLGPSAVQSAASASTLELGLARSALPTLSPGAGVRFVDLKADWSEQGRLPSTGYATLAAPRFGKGLVIPAYLPVGSTDPAEPSYDAAALASWTVIAEGARTVKNGRNPSFKDYWVVVNSAHNGPFGPSDAPAAWAWGAAQWDRIRAEDGVIFGYVHTCATPVGPSFRPLDDVKADVSAWVRGYPALGGIWLDEFYPRFELANSDATIYFPNGQAAAPTDLTWYNGGSPLWGLQVDPSGGYYDQLAKWIRATYPNLRIIGNAGGWFYSNQTNYAEVVDVTCSFEQTLAAAQTNPATGAVDGQWTGLERANTWTTHGQLALIHTNSTDLVGAIEQSIAKGYTHFYTTDRLLQDNIWGGLPPYFASEVQYVADRP